MSGHTPGPWTKVNGELFGPHGRRVLVSDSGIGVVCGSNPDPEHEANARLIAAAPELLEALRDLLRAVGRAGYDDADSGELFELDSAAEEARAVIAKATGVAQ